MVDKKDFKRLPYTTPPICWDGDCDRAGHRHESCQWNQTKISSSNPWSMMSQPGAKKKTKESHNWLFFIHCNGRCSRLVSEYCVMLSQDEDRATALINTENIRKFFNKSYSLEQLCVQYNCQTKAEYMNMTHTHRHMLAHMYCTCTFTLHAVFIVPKQVHNFARLGVTEDCSLWRCWQQRYPLESFTGRTAGNTDVRTSKLTMASALSVPLLQTTHHHIQENCDLHLHLKTIKFCLLTYKL